MSKALETTLCLNTFNRESAIYPEPNDFVLDLKGRYEVQFASLGSIELPLTQYTVEEDWSAFSFDVGSSIPDAICRSLAVKLPGGELESALILPAPWIAVTSNGDGSWSSSEPHGIAPSALRVDGFKANVITSEQFILPIPVLQVIDEMKIYVGDMDIADEGTYGLLQVQNSGVRTFSTPAQLAAVLSATFSDLGWPLRVTWHQDTATAELNAPKGTVVYVNELSLLLHALGFLCRGGGVAVFPLFSENFPLGSRVTRRINPGHYDPSSFRSHFEALVNPLSMCGVVPTSMFAVEIWGSDKQVAIEVPQTRSYHPRGIAMVITEIMATADVKVSLKFEDDCFIFLTGSKDPPFLILWGTNPSDQDFASRLGFDASPTPLGRSIKGAPCHFIDIPTSIQLPLSLGGVSINNDRKFILTPKPRIQRSAQAQIVIATSDGLDLWVPTGAIPIEYVLMLNGIFAVARRVEGNRTFLQAQGPVPPSGSYNAEVVPVMGASMSLYHLLPPRTCFSKLADIMGFVGGTSSYSSIPGTPGGLVAPNAWNFEPPPYLLLELGLQHMSALISHRCKEDLKTQIMGKITLYPPFKMERGYPIQKSGTGVSYVTTLKVQLFNPWHSLYQFHGREWSMTLILGSSQRTAHTECP
jgi:hypothetical protein